MLKWASDGARTNGADWEEYATFFDTCAGYLKNGEGGRCYVKWTSDCFWKTPADQFRYEGRAQCFVGSRERAERIIPPHESEARQAEILEWMLKKNRPR
jgi:hypothetical protein